MGRVDLGLTVQVAYFSSVSVSGSSAYKKQITAAEAAVFKRLGFVKMAGSQNSSDLQQILKPLFARAAEAEERLSRLEAGLTANKDGSDVRDENFSSLVRGIQSKLVINAAETEQACETQAPKELQMRTAGNEKEASGSLNLLEENSKIVAANTKLTTENATILAENTKLEAEIAKLKYRITHLVRALKGADCS